MDERRNQSYYGLIEEIESGESIDYAYILFIEKCINKQAEKFFSDLNGILVEFKKDIISRIKTIKDKSNLHKLGIDELRCEFKERENEMNKLKLKMSLLFPEEEVKVKENRKANKVIHKEDK